MSVVLSGIQAEIAFTEFNLTNALEVSQLSMKWGVSEDKVYELIDLYFAHAPLIWQECFERLSQMTYKKAKLVVTLACEGVIL